MYTYLCSSMFIFLQYRDCYRDVLHLSTSVCCFQPILLQKCCQPQYICVLFPAHDVTEMLPTSVHLYVVSSPYCYRNVANLSTSVCCFQPMMLLQKCCPPQYICVLFPAHDAHGGQRFYQHLEPTSAVQPNW